MLGRLVRLEAWRHPLPLLALLLLGVIAGVSVALLAPLARYALAVGRLAATGSSEERSLLVLPPPADAAKPGQDGRFSAEQLALCAGLPGLERIRAVWSVPIPATIIMRLRPIIESEQFLIVEALEPAAVAPELRGRWAATEGPLPLLANPAIIRMYNAGFAERYNLPRLSAELMQRISWQLVLGADQFWTLDGHQTFAAELVGYSADVDTWGVAVPLHRVRDLIDRLVGARDLACRVQRQTLVFVDNTARDAARERLAAAGLELEDDSMLGAVLRRARQALAWALPVLLAGIGALVVLLAALTAALVVGERRRNVRLYVDQGAGLRHLLAIFASGMLAAILVGILGGLILAGGLLPATATRLDALLLGPPEERVVAPPPCTYPGGNAALVLLAGLLTVLLATLPALTRTRRRLLGDAGQDD